MKIKVEIELTDEQIDDIVDTALNGIAYWAHDLEYGKQPSPKPKYMSEALSHGGTLKFRDEDGGKHELTRENMARGVAMAVTHTQAQLEDFDAADADNAVQYAVFGELVYA